MKPASRAPLWGLVFLLSVVVAGCAAGSGTAPPAPPGVPLDVRLEALLSQPPFDRVHWGVLVVEPATDRVLYERNPDRLFIPASNMKIPVAAAALGLLGPDYRWETTFYARGRPVDGVLPGDLYLPGRGDPTLGAPFFDPPDRALEALADSLWAAGVREVEGALVLDASAWDSTTVPESWMMEDLDGAYGATGGAFAVRTGELEIEVRAGSDPGEPASVSWVPHGPPLRSDGGSVADDSDPAAAADPEAAATDPEEDPAPEDLPANPRGRSATTAAFEPFVRHEVVTVPPTADGDAPPEIRVEFRPESRHWLVTGAIEVGATRRFTRSSRDPNRLAVSALAGALADRGIEVHGGGRILWDAGIPLETRCASGRIAGCAEMLRIAGMASPPLAEVVPAILAPSQNWMTEQVVRTLGEEFGEKGNWEEGFDAILSYLEHEVGIEPDHFHFEDGSGMSAQNLVSPRAIVAILAHARSRPWGDGFREGMARPGADDTTLQSRLSGLEGRVFAKTGTISHVNSLSGYLLHENGQEWIFSVLSNGANVPAGVVRERIDAIVGAVAEAQGVNMPLSLAD